jgi:glutaredoxin
MARRKTPAVVIYTTRHCTHCKQAIRQLKAWKVVFREMDIESNHRAYAEFRRLRARGVPVIAVGERHLFGFDQKRLRQLLENAGIEISG